MGDELFLLLHHQELLTMMWLSRGVVLVMPPCFLQHWPAINKPVDMHIGDDDGTR
jgi:hypothetical protein